ncbi:uncharacterized protein LOC126988263 isoform X2 [Eriocheir sinensis]|nr:uncharacterized protein LOC126988263 isoform X2 [Eriocheir sinensis]
MLSWVKEALAHVKPRKKRRSNSSVVSTFSGGGEEPESAEDSLGLLKEEIHKTNNDDHIRHLMLPTPLPSTSPSAPTSSHHSPSPPPPLSTRLSGAPALQPPHVYPALAPCSQPPTPSNTQPTPPSSLPSLSPLEPPTSRNTNDNALSIPEPEMPLGSQQSPQVPEEDFSAGQENQSENTLQAAAGDVLGPTIDESSYPSCFMTTALTSQIGQLVTVQDEKYVLVVVMGNVQTVFLSGEPRNIPPCRLVWRAAQPVPLVELPDSTFVEVDAVVCPESKRLHAVVIWQDTKPGRCLQLLNDTYLFLDSRNVTYWPRFEDILARKLAVLFDGTIVSAEVCDAVVFIGLAKATLAELLQHNLEQCNATVYKVLEGTGGGRVLYVCTCLWVGQKPPSSSLPMVVNKKTLYARESHGLYTTTEKKVTLCLDLDASLCVSDGTATLQVDLDGSRRSLKATDPLGLEPGCQEASETTRVSVHVRRENFCKKPKKLVAFSAAMIKPPDSTVLDAIFSKMSAWDLLSKAAPHCPSGSKDISMEVCKSDSAGHSADGQQVRVSSSLKASAPVVQNASVPAAQNTPTTAAQNTPKTAAQNTPTTAAQNTPTTAAQNTPNTAAQNTPKTAAQNTPTTAAQNTPKTAAQNTPTTAAQNTPKTAAQNTPTTAAQNTPKTAAQNTPTTAAQNTPKTAAQNTPTTAAQNTPTTAAQNTPKTASQNTPTTGAQNTPKTAAQNTPTTAAQKGSVPPTQKTSGTDAQKPSGTAAQKGSVPPTQKTSGTSSQKTSGTAAQKTSGKAAKTNKKSASLSQLSDTGKQWDYLTCSVLAADSSVAVVTGAGKKIIVAKADLFVNGAPLKMKDNVALILKKVPNLGVMYMQSHEVHEVHGHFVDLVTVAAWVGKKPSSINNIVEQRLSALKKVAAPKVTPPPTAARKVTPNQTAAHKVTPTPPAAPKVTPTPPAAPKVTPVPPAPLPAGVTTVIAVCMIRKIIQNNAILVVRSKFLPGNCGTAQARLCDMYDNGTPITQTEVNVKDKVLWHCQLKINNNGKQLKVPVAWRGKKPGSNASSKSTESQPPRQALSTGDLTTSFSRPLGTVAFIQQDGRQTPPSSPPKVLKGEVAEVLAEGGRLRGEDGRDYLFSLDVCFLFGVCLHHIEPSQVLQVGMMVEFEVAERSRSKSSEVTEEAVRRVWMEGEDASLALLPTDSMIDSWCSDNSVSSATRDALKQEAELLSPSLFPTALKMEATTTVDIS